jgi:hypothetical protein
MNNDSTRKRRVQKTLGLHYSRFYLIARCIDSLFQRKILENRSSAAPVEKVGLAAETACRADFESARFLGVYQHMYSNNRFGEPDVGTHYVVLAYELSLNPRPAVMLDSQHSICEWMDEADLKSRHTVHQYTKAYFQN